MIAHAAPTTPTGLGSLIPIPDLAGSGTKSLFESHAYDFSIVDSTVGVPDFVNLFVGALVNVVWGLATALAMMTVGAVYWLLSLTSMSELTEPLAGIIGSSSETLMAWLLPSAVVIGLVKSYLQHNGKQILGSISWVLIAAIIGSSLALFPQKWVDGANTIRTLGADAAASIGTAAVTAPNQQIPFEWENTNYGEGDQGSPDETPGARRNRLREVQLRKTGDAVWRGLVVTPWCAVEFGSIEACKRYGAAMIKLTPDQRKQYIENDIVQQEGSDDAPTVQWVKGERSPERLVVAIAALLTIIVFLGGMLILGFAAIAAFVSMMLHLVVGVFFSLTWCIEGRAREIGLRWFESLVGTILQAAIALLTFSGVLLLVTSVYAAVGSTGYLATSILALVAVITGIGFRKQVAGFFGFLAPGRQGSLLAGAMAFRLATRGVRGAGSAARSAGAALSSRSRPGTPSSRPAGSGTGPGASPSGSRSTGRVRPSLIGAAAQTSSLSSSADTPGATGRGTGTPAAAAGHGSRTATGPGPSRTDPRRPSAARAGRSNSPSRTNGSRANGSRPSPTATSTNGRGAAATPRPAPAPTATSGGGAAAPRANASRRVAAADAARAQAAPQPRGATQHHPTKRPAAGGRPLSARERALASPQTRRPGSGPRPGGGAYPSRRRGT